MKIKNILLSWKNANFPRTYLAAGLICTHGPEEMKDRIYDLLFQIMSCLDKQSNKFVSDSLVY